MSPSALLLVTAGRTDVQPLALVNGVLSICRIERGVRAAHERFLSNPQLYRATSDYEVTGHRASLEWQSGTLAWPTGVEPHRDAEERLLLALPKIRDILKLIPHEPRIRRVLCVGTERNAGHRQARDEPIAAAPLMAAELARRLGLAVAGSAAVPADGEAAWMNWLIADEEQEGSGDDHPLLRRAVQRVDGRLRQIATDMGAEGWALLATTGGLGDLKATLRASVRFHFRDRVQVIHASEWRREALEPEPDRRPDIDASLDVRRQVLNLLDRGDFVGAAAAVPAAFVKHEPAWARPVAIVGRLFAFTATEDDMREVPEWARFLLRNCDIDEVALIACRVEAALSAPWDATGGHGPRWTEAAIGTVSLIDAVLCRALSRLGWVERVDGEDLYVRDGCEIPAACTTVVTEKRRGESVVLGSPLRPRQANPHGISFAPSLLPRWAACLADELQGPFCEYAKLLQKQVTFTPDTQLTPRSLRNGAAHRVLNHEEILRLREVMTQCGLWTSAAPPGTRFAASAAVSALLDAVGVADVAAHHSRLLAELTALIRNHRLDGVAAPARP